MVTGRVPIVEVVTDLVGPGAVVDEVMISTLEPPAMIKEYIHLIMGWAT